MNIILQHEYDTPSHFGKFQWLSLHLLQVAPEIVCRLQGTWHFLSVIWLLPSSSVQDILLQFLLSVFLALITQSVCSWAVIRITPISDVDCLSKGSTQSPPFLLQLDIQSRKIVAQLKPHLCKLSRIKIYEYRLCFFNSMTYRM